MNAKPPLLPLVVAGPVPRAARAALRRAGARLHRADGAEQALGAALAHDALLVVAAPALAADGLASLLEATGRGADLLVLGKWEGRGGCCAWRGLARRFRRRALERRRAEAAFTARPGWVAMVQAYRSHLSERMAELARAHEAGDAATALQVVHDVKGTAGGYGFGQLTTACAQAQDHFLAGDAASGFAWSERLMRQADQALR